MQEVSFVGENFGSRLRRLAKQSGLSAAALAHSINVSPTTVSRWMDGRAEPVLTNLKALSDALNVDLNYLAKDIEVQTAAWQDFKATKIYGLTNKNDMPKQSRGENIQKINTIGFENNQSKQIHVTGLASCGIEGWNLPSDLPLTIEVPPDVDLESAFAVIGVGVSATGWGVQDSRVHICDPTQEARIGDLVYLETKEFANQGYSVVAQIKLFVSRTEDYLTFAGWMPQEDNPNTQRLLEISISSEIVMRLVPVIWTKNRSRYKK